MGKQSQKEGQLGVVRIWPGPKKRLVKLIEKKVEREGRPFTEVELVSKAVEQLCQKEEKKLGIA